MRFALIPSFARAAKRQAAWFVWCVLLATVASCTDGPTAVVGAPYLAVVVIVDAPDEVTSRGPYGFRVRELSGTIRYDTVFQATPRDTIILSVAQQDGIAHLHDRSLTLVKAEGGSRLIAVAIPAAANVD